MAFGKRRDGLRHRAKRVHRRRGLGDAADSVRVRRAPPRGARAPDTSRVPRRASSPPISASFRRAVCAATSAGTSSIDAVSEPAMVESARSRRAHARAHASRTGTRRAWTDLFFSTRRRMTGPISAVPRTCVPPQALRSVPSISTIRIFAGAIDGLPQAGRGRGILERHPHGAVLEHDLVCPPTRPSARAPSRATARRGRASTTRRRSARSPSCARRVPRTPRRAGAGRCAAACGRTAASQSTRAVSSSSAAKRAGLSSTCAIRSVSSTTSTTRTSPSVPSVELLAARGRVEGGAVEVHAVAGHLHHTRGELGEPGVGVVEAFGHAACGRWRCGAASASRVSRPQHDTLTRCRAHGQLDRHRSRCRLTDVTIKFLEMNSPAELRPKRTSLAGVTVTRVPQPMPELNRFFYATVGADYSWIDRLSWPLSRWRECAEQSRSRHLRPRRGRDPRGLLRARSPREPRDRDQVLRPARRLSSARGSAAHMLTAAVEAAWAEGAKRVILDTCSLDHPRAFEQLRRARVQAVSTPTS